MKKDISQNIVNKIKNKKIKPIPKWKFILRNYLCIFTFVGFSILGGIPASIFIYQILNNDWDLSRTFASNYFSFIIVTLPYFWVLLLLLILVFSHYYLRKTKKGYKYGAILVILSSFSISIASGVLFYNYKISHRVERMMDRMPIYRQINHFRNSFWENPENGFLLGELEKSGEMNLLLKDFKSNIWAVNISNIDKDLLLDLAEDERRLKIKGEKTGNFKFDAYEIRFFEGKKKILRKLQNKGPFGKKLRPIY